MGTQLPNPKSAQPPQFSAHVCYGLVASVWKKNGEGKGVKGGEKSGVPNGV